MQTARASTREHHGDREAKILAHPDLEALVAEKVNQSDRQTRMVPWDPSHTPGPLKEVLVRKPGKKSRQTHSPEDTDYVQAQFYRLGTLTPIVNASRPPHEYGIGTGAGNQHAAYELRQELNRRIAAGKEVTLLAADIADCFPTCPTERVEAMLEELAPLTARYIRKVHERYQIFSGRGTPQGHPIATSVVALALQPSWKDIRAQLLGTATLFTYIDDILIVLDSREEAKIAEAIIARRLAADGMTIRATKTRTYHLEHEPGDYLGFRTYSNAEGATLTPHPHKLKDVTTKLENATGREQRRSILNGYRSAYSAADPAALDLLVEYALQGFRR